MTLEAGRAVTKRGFAHIYAVDDAEPWRWTDATQIDWGRCVGHRPSSNASWARARATGEPYSAGGVVYRPRRRVLPLAVLGDARDRGSPREELVNAKLRNRFTGRSDDTFRARRRLRGGTHSLAALVVLLGAAVLVAGCGGGSSLGVASINGSTRSVKHPSRSGLGGGGGVVRFVGAAPSPAQRASAEVAGLLFSRCMRAHGVPNFPDPPAASGGGFGFAFGSGQLDPAAPLFRRAQQVCISYLTRRGGAG